MVGRTCHLSLPTRDTALLAVTGSLAAAAATASIAKHLAQPAQPWGMERELAAEKHVRYIVTMEKQKDSFESLVMEHIRLNGAYWGLTTLDLLHKLHAVEADEFIEWIMSCYHPDQVDWGGNVGHDAHVLYTLSAGQVLCLFDRLDALDVDKVADCILHY
ncbi:hypothetical protein EE612_055826 [Oryza sativa]|nr:hypothetical protein EE612_055826 [Oryza sativa]